MSRRLFSQRRVFSSELNRAGAIYSTRSTDRYSMSSQTSNRTRQRTRCTIHRKVRLRTIRIVHCARCSLPWEPLKLISMHPIPRSTSKQNDGIQTLLRTFEILIRCRCSLLLIVCLSEYPTRSTRSMRVSKRSIGNAFAPIARLCLYSSRAVSHRNAIRSRV